MFKFLISILAVAGYASICLAGPTSTVVTYDRTFDNPKYSLNNVACSNGVNGLVTKGYTTFDSLPGYPYVGGASFAGWNSTECGSCWQLTYNSTSINVIVVDRSYGFNIAQAALDKLTNNQAVNFGKIAADAVEVAPVNCGFS